MTKMKGRHAWMAVKGGKDSVMFTYNGGGVLEEASASGKKG